MSSEPVRARRSPADSPSTAGAARAAASVACRATAANSAAGGVDSAGAAGVAGSAGATRLVASAGEADAAASALAPANSHDTAPDAAGGGGSAPASCQTAGPVGGAPGEDTRPSVAAPPEPQPPQLRMQFRAFASLQAVSLPPGYTLATLAERDLDDWIAVLNATGRLGAWDLARAERCLNDPRPVVPAGTYLVMHRGRPVATACTVLPTPAEPRHELGWVAVDPAHQGNGLASQVCAAVLWYARRRGWRASILSTDDWRLPAIRTYLKLGFEPEVTHDSHPARWQEVHRLLATPAAASLPGTRGGAK